ncbi:unnamed protein product [Ranitomeya imitator]|uniref:RRM domain-containing protein n=1 Tax=Ranitomeya imitator TaxID=111125 RepID=A0ABN9LMD7_9NEOB|nr:unnamed protein product [Ranitomeya imitator]
MFESPQLHVLGLFDNRNTCSGWLTNRQSLHLLQLSNSPETCSRMDSNIFFEHAKDTLLAPKHAQITSYPSTFTHHEWLYIVITSDISENMRTRRVRAFICETKISEVEPAAESYVAGEVSDSLFPKKSNQGTNSLSSLFNTKASSAQPLYVPVVITKTKRKFPEPDEAKKSKQAAAVLQEAEPKSKVAKKELTLSEKRVEDREQALTNADEAEKKKTAKMKNLKNNKYSEDEDLTKQEKKKMIMAEERVKNKRTVFVGNLPSSCTKQMLKSCFKEFGAIETMRFRSVARADPTESRKVAAIKRNLHPKRKSINAYVVFKEEASATKAIVRNGFEIGSGFHIRVDLASKSPTHNNKKTVFVGNLPYGSLNAKTNLPL